MFCDISSMPFEPLSIDYHKMMAATAEAGIAVRKRASILQIAKDLWSLDRKFGSLLAELRQITTMDAVQLREIASNLRGLHSKVAKVMDSARQRGYTNRTLTAGSVRSILHRNLELADIVEGFEISLDHEVQAAITGSWAEYNEGETVALTSVN